MFLLHVHVWHVPWCKQILGEGFYKKKPSSCLASDFSSIQWNLSWKTAAMGDHLSGQTTHFRQKDLHFNTTEPVTRDHLSWQTTFLWPMEWCFKTGCTVLLPAHYLPETGNITCTWKFFQKESIWVHVVHTVDHPYLLTIHKLVNAITGIGIQLWWRMGLLYLVLQSFESDSEDARFTNHGLLIFLAIILHFI